MSNKNEVSANQVFLGGLSAETSATDVSALFAQLNISSESVSIFEDATGRSKGCALAKFASAEAADAAIAALNGKEVNGKEIVARADRGPRKARPAPVNEDQSYIYVGNLSHTTADALTAFFASCGTVVECNLSRKRRDEDSKGWASIKFSSDAEAAAAHALNGTDFNGDAISVESLRRPPRARKSRARKPRGERAAAPQQEEQAAEEEANAAVLHVGNLSWNVEEEALEALFAPHGQVLRCEVARDKRSGKSRGWGIVEFGSADEASAATAALNGHAVDERELTVEVRRGRARKARKAREPAAEEGEDGERRRRRRPRKQREAGAGDEDQDAPVGGRRRRRRDDGEPRERKEPEKRVVSNPGCHLYVGNLPWDVDDASLQQLFAQYGAVASASVKMNPKGDRSRGHGTVEMASPADASAAQQALHDFEFGGRQLLVREDNHVISN